MVPPVFIWNVGARLGLVCVSKAAAVRRAGICARRRSSQWRWARSPISRPGSRLPSIGALVAAARRARRGRRRDCFSSARAAADRRFHVDAALGRARIAALADPGWFFAYPLMGAWLVEPGRVACTSGDGRSEPPPCWRPSPRSAAWHSATGWTLAPCRRLARHPAIRRSKPCPGPELPTRPRCGRYRISSSPANGGKPARSALRSDPMYPSSFSPNDPRGVAFLDDSAVLSAATPSSSCPPPRPRRRDRSSRTISSGSIRRNSRARPRRTGRSPAGPHSRACLDARLSRALSAQALSAIGAPLYPRTLQ